ncbi:hypothetical protein TcasGA2_TC032935 [Tribolium castaneum]|uniref:Protein TsetseEP domain-containing protein n=1 Tax=Tribolium castaneum TaxID=7070 RepID=A0A139WJF3_TRICA|nr:PREDICTED: uncharacterized protein LOC661206 isoform X2 [Tribolium castaneum]KYB28168.1 hypothetical protein TcasGA2_TC032935 [Tribolium castaneum]|eukprot:XP_015834975.1 PREDICTED: uncharacterized protein LOC661206 isoform X2 [Tribolium castaneum]
MGSKIWLTIPHHALLRQVESSSNKSVQLKVLSGIANISPNLKSLSKSHINCVFSQGVTVKMLNLVTVVILGALLQGNFCLNRQDIIDEYTPILAEKTANFSQDAKTIHSELVVVENILKNDTLSTISFLNTQIASLKQTIADAKKQSANKTTVLNCLSVQEKAAAQLSADAINTTCWANADFSALSGAENDLKTLALIPNNTISACQTLDPLSPSQDQLFLDCITEKILDLDAQIEIVENNFAAVKNATVTSTIKCITDQSAPIAAKINEISFQVTLCLSLG